MLYKLPTFTCPSSHNTSQKRWDFAFMDKPTFCVKYKITEKEYEALKNAGSL